MGVTNKHLGREIFKALGIPHYATTASLPDPVLGELVYDDEANALKVGDGSAWVGATTATPNTAAITDGPGAPTTAANALKHVRQNSGSTALEYVFEGQKAVIDKTDNYTTVLADAGKVITMNNAGAKAVTIPANGTVAYPVGTEIEVYAYTDDQSVAVTADTLKIPTGKTAVIMLDGTAKVRKVAATVWALSGDLV